MNAQPGPESPAAPAAQTAEELPPGGPASGSGPSPAAEPPLPASTAPAAGNPTEEPRVDGSEGGADPDPSAPDPSTPGTEVDPSPQVEQADPAPTHPDKLVYVLERVDIRGNRTRPSVIRGFLPLQVGESFDPNDQRLTLARLRMIGTGWFDDVRFSLERGSRRGAAVLVIDVQERNTLLIERVVAGLSRVVQDSDDSASPVRPYAGLGLTETNLLGLGIGVSGAAVASLAPDTGQLLQYGLDLRYNDGSLAGSEYDLRARLFHNHAREFFGRRPRVRLRDKCPAPEMDDVDMPCDPDIEGKRAVVIYNRTGLGFGSGNDLTDTLHYTFGWLGERVDVESKPLAADTQRGRDADQNREAIDFRIEDDASYVSSLELGLVLDTRDHPATPSRGNYLALTSRIGTGMLGSDYDFIRVEAEYRHYLVLPWSHQLQVGAYAGSVFGQAPFFYHFYAADLSALLPSRQLELNLDHRRTHNLLGTSIVEMDQEELAARIEVEYQLPIMRGGSTVRRLDAYLGVGLFMLARRADLRLAIPGYDGLSRVPVDLTFDLGVVADTTFGLFKVGFSSLIGFLPDLGQELP